MATMLAAIQKIQRGEVPPPPVASLIGFSLREAAPGRAIVDFEADARHANPMGTLHGGILCDVADAAMGIAYAATLSEGETFTTIELKINFLKPVWTGKRRQGQPMYRRPPQCPKNTENTQEVLNGGLCAE